MILAALFGLLRFAALPDALTVVSSADQQMSAEIREALLAVYMQLSLIFAVAVDCSAVRSVDEQRSFLPVL